MPKTKSINQYEINRRTPNAILAAAMASVALLGAVKMIDRGSQASGRTVTETVQAGDSDWTIAERAEEKYGRNPEDFVLADEADRLEQKYGTIIHPGQKLKVNVK